MQKIVPAFLVKYNNPPGNYYCFPPCIRRKHLQMQVSFLRFPQYGSCAAADCAAAAPLQNDAKSGTHMPPHSAPLLLENPKLQKRAIFSSTSAGRFPAMRASSFPVRLRSAIPENASGLPQMPRSTCRQPR
jgi:hypothetical protein